MTETLSRPLPPTSRNAVVQPAVTLIERLLPADAISLTVRVAVAAVFFLSGRTKVEGVLTITDGTYFLFAEEYKVPLITSELAAHLATYAEHLFPALIVLGLLTRVSALALLAMTLVIQIFVYPTGWPTHLLWAACLLFLVRFGAGRLSLDRLFRWP
ncbi:DoxX family protein [Brevundimonas variabilis]|uniref:Putative oxidoreductase n=1 Tax=Brevundimonas variabilis TaxID=74312 RepID=A0A7W9FE66_9CAUL|nr:DoxX family protein [Brevundimonas variabilis]MBB5745945.1 putative oxidoreductase [Brevundimonas variabilis]